MKRSIYTAVAFIFLLSTATAQKTQLVKKWETDSILKVPESVLYDANNKILYVANIDGQPGEKDGKGSIGKVGLDGTVVSASWVSGLNAPKGMGLHKNTLWVADLDEVVAIDITNGSVTQKVKVDGAQFLNDVTVDKNGVVYVSDSRTKKVHRIENGKATDHLVDLKGPNGLLVHENVLYVLDSGGLYKVGEDKSLTMITDGMEGGTDGIEHVKDNDFIVSSWSGVVYYVKGDGSKEKLLDTRDQKINSADIGYDAKNRIVYVPTFWKNSVVAYELK
jgi:hypothetical protein